jgi:PTS system N-acetylglucosamine-specific IIC component
VTGDRGQRFVAALGGAGNLLEIEACTTRLRLRLADPEWIDEAALKALGSRGLVRPGGDAAQVVLGPIADQVAGEMRDACKVARPFDTDALATAFAAAEITAVVARDTRILVKCAQAEAALLDQLAVRDATRSGEWIHLIVGPEANAFAERLRPR